MTTPYWSDFIPNSTFYRILSGFHRTFATGVACRQGTLTPPDTWSCPFWDLHLFYLLRPATSYIDWTLYQFVTLLPDLTLSYWIWHFTKYWFPYNICNGCGMPTGDADSSGHPVPSLWDLRMFYLLRPILFRTCRYFTGLCSSNIPRYFLDFCFALAYH